VRLRIFSDLEKDGKMFSVFFVLNAKAKIDIGQFSNSEREFFSSPHQFKKDYWRKLMP